MTDPRDADGGLTPREDTSVHQLTLLSTDAGGQPTGIVDEAAPLGGLTAVSGADPHRSYPQPVDESADERDGDAGGDLARAALAGLRSGRDPRGFGRASDRDKRRAAVRRANLAGRNRGGYSAARPDPERDPARVGDLVDDFVSDQGWQRPLADARVFAEWPLLVGAEVAAHCAPQALRDGELRVTAQSTAWATQLRLLLPVLHSRLVAELGAHVVRRIVITGPTAPSWRHGQWSVRGARGPRDTYG